MCLFEGGDMAKLIRERKRQRKYFSEVTLRTWLLQLSIALEYMHKHKILHRGNCFALPGPWGASVSACLLFGYASLFVSRAPLLSVCVRFRLSAPTHLFLFHSPCVQHLCIVTCSYLWALSWYVPSSIRTKKPTNVERGYSK